MKTVWQRKRMWRRPPPWWPENEPWPPSGAPWRRMKGRFFLRVTAWLTFMFLISVFACTLTLYLVAGLSENLNLSLESALFGLALVLGLGLLFLVTAARGWRRLATPFGQLLDAAGRVAEGDYSVRVSEGGAREVRALAAAFNSMTARLQTQDEQRRNLLADISHELRTPLTVIQANLEGLIDDIYPRDDAHLELILEETQVLSRLMEDLRTLALAESGALKLRKEPTDLAALVTETTAGFRPQAESAGVRLSVAAQAQSAPLNVDPARIREVLANLISNALAYTPVGGEIRVAYTEDENRHATLSVSDTGSGISAEDLPHIFDRFYRTKESPGSGLGLAIAKKLVEAHNGEIEVHSRIGQGTTVQVHLPLDPDHE